jgi:transposase InsO family protein
MPTPSANGLVVDDAMVFGRKLQEWEDFYNFERPRGALGGQTPTSDYARESAAPASPAYVGRTARRDITRWEV